MHNAPIDSGRKKLQKKKNIPNGKGVDLMRGFQSLF